MRRSGFCWFVWTLGLAAGCSNGSTASFSSPTDGMGDGSAVPVDSVAETSTGPTQADADAFATFADGVFDASHLRAVLWAPPSVPPGARFPVIARLADGERASLSLTLVANGERAVRLYRGLGSASLVAASSGPLQLSVADLPASAPLTVDVAARPERRLSGSLGAEGLVWDDTQDIRITADIVIPSGALLIVRPGTRVLLDPGASVLVQGEMRAEGTSEAPVLFTRDAGAAWGSVRFLAGATASLSHTWFTGGGGDAQYVFGHSQSAPVVYAEDATLSMTGGGVVDNVGKGFGALHARLALTGIVDARNDSGGEFLESQLRLIDSFVHEMPDVDETVQDDDNDGIYLCGELQSDGGVLESMVRGCVFARGDDDGIDHNGARVRVEQSWIEGFVHEGVAASSASRIEIVDTVVRHCEQGIEAGYGSPEVIVDHCLVTDNDVGLRYGDSYDWDVNGTLRATATVVARSRVHQVYNFVNNLGGPREGAMSIACSMVNSPEWDGRDGNLVGTPVWTEDGCVIVDTADAAACAGSRLGPSRCTAP